LENGGPESVVEYVCELAHLRAGAAGVGSW